MPIAIWVRALLLAAFAWQCRRDICRQARGYARIARLCIDSAGEVQGRGPLGQTYQLRLCSGSMVLPRLAWLRLEFADGHRYGELIYGNSAESAEWHGLQLIWEQRRASFGRAGLS